MCFANVNNAQGRVSQLQKDGIQYCLVSSIASRYSLPLSKPIADTSHYSWPAGGLHQSIHDLQGEGEGCVK